MISWTSSLASSIPATSSKVILFVSRVSSRARLLPKPSAPCPAERIWRMKRKYRMPKIRRTGRTLEISCQR